MITLKNEELRKRVEKELTEDVEEKFYVIGLRFENVERKVGDIIEEYSKDNSEREDERDFPEYGTKEYEELEELDGISSWDINFWEYQLTDWSDETTFEGDHIYLLGGEKHSFGPDDHELVIEDAEIIAIIA